MLSIIYAEYRLCWVSFMLSVTYAERYIKAPYDECRYAECRYAECRVVDPAQALGVQLTTTTNLQMTGKLIEIFS